MSLDRVRNALANLKRVCEEKSKMEQQVKLEPRLVVMIPKASDSPYIIPPSFPANHKFKVRDGYLSVREPGLFGSTVATFAPGCWESARYMMTDVHKCDRMNRELRLAA